MRSNRYDNFEMIYQDENFPIIVKIYDITYDKNGFPMFLIYHNGQWIRKSAKYFKPIDW